MKTIIAVIFLVFVIIVGLTAIEKDKALFYYELNYGSSSLVSEAQTSTVKVKLTGCVEKPGTYTIDSGAFLDDALSKAGGITLEADIYCFDFYLIVEEDLEIYIAKSTTAEKTSINEADVDDLMKLSGIGKTIATRIVEYRTENGEFTYLEQIMKVSGVGKSIFNNIKDKICL